MRKSRRRDRMKRIKVMSVFGTRPEAIKMAPLVQTLAQRPEFESICCLTGQHREMLDSVMEIFDLKADFDLNIMEKRQTLSKLRRRRFSAWRRSSRKRNPTLFWCTATVHDVCRSPGGILPSGEGRPCGSRSSHVGQIFSLPGGDEPDAGRRYRGSSFFAHEGECREPPARGSHG